MAALDKCPSCSGFKVVGEFQCRFCHEKFKSSLTSFPQTGTEEIEKPKRYNKIGKLECWDVILDQQMGFLEGNILKYIWRHKEKNGLEDLKKARVYLDKLIAEEEKK